MPNIQHKNLPAGFEYPITKREIRAFLSETEANFEAIRFKGISYSDQYFNKWDKSNTHFSAGLIRAVRGDDGWHFTLELNGLKRDHFQERRCEASEALLRVVKDWVHQKLLFPETAPNSPTGALIGFDFTKAGISTLSNFD